MKIKVDFIIALALTQYRILNTKEIGILYKIGLD